MKPKLDALDEEFKETLDKYDVNSITPIEEVKCVKGDPKSIRRYQALKNATLYD